MLMSPVVVYLVLVVAVLIFGYSVFMHLKLISFLSGSDGATLEKAFIEDRIGVKKVLDENKVLNTRVETLEKKMTQAVRAVDTVRFNPFADQGSNQSFATALLDESGNGVVLSSLYARDRVSVFAKPVTNSTSTYELTVEEKQTIENSKKKQYAK
jgi:uncharacterized Ntn-hydrolase superfamily protein